MPRKGFSSQQSKQLETVAGRAYALRYTWPEAREYIKIEMKLDKSITKQAYYKIISRILTKGGEWMRELQASHNAYYSEYRQHYEVMLNNLWRMEKIAKKHEAEGRDMPAIIATRECQAIVKDLIRFNDLVPWIVGGKGLIHYDDLSQGTGYTNSELPQEGTRETATEETKF